MKPAVVIHWDGHDTTAILRELNRLAPGRYIVLAEETDERDLSPDEVDGIDRALERKDAGEPGVLLDVFVARRRAAAGSRP